MAISMIRKDAFVLIFMTVVIFVSNSKEQKDSFPNARAAFVHSVKYWKTNNCVFPPKILYSFGRTPFLSPCWTNFTKSEEVEKQNLFVGNICTSLANLATTVCESNDVIRGYLKDSVVVAMLDSDQDAEIDVCKSIESLKSNLNISEESNLLSYINFVKQEDCKQFCVQKTGVRFVCLLLSGSLNILMKKYPADPSNSGTDDDADSTDIVATATRPDVNVISANSTTGVNTSTAASSNVNSTQGVNASTTASSSANSTPGVNTSTAASSNVNSTQGVTASTTAISNANSTQGINTSTAATSNAVLVDVVGTSPIGNAGSTQGDNTSTTPIISASSTQSVGTSTAATGISASTEVDSMSTSAVNHADSTTVNTVTGTDNGNVAITDGKNDVDANTDRKNGDGTNGVKGKDSGAGYISNEPESPGSGNFMAYFLTVVVLCIAGYVVFHNKQKIMGFIVEGRASRQRRRTSGGGKYKKLESGVEEVVPSLDKSSSVKNFIY
ncbi:Y' element ATP-dependent helicase YEL077C-like [Gigantopelta aegis]|uniref:Y' element ATP-dependent helicase YEL077C-like n=1 Tax=Gigantopelta aegis TaxID=1735272 RepID=UPI001B8879C7|nr:Y' element ATP-dependent helicase YEL077C-like [Gigantopelta aegis]